MWSRMAPDSMQRCKQAQLRLPGRCLFNFRPASANFGHPSIAQMSVQQTSSNISFQSMLCFMWQRGHEDSEVGAGARLVRNS